MLIGDVASSIWAALPGAAPRDTELHRVRPYGGAARMLLARHVIHHSVPVLAASSTT
jgi:hypothetical protein